MARRAAEEVWYPAGRPVSATVPAIPVAQLDASTLNETLTVLVAPSASAGCGRGPNGSWTEQVTTPVPSVTSTFALPSTVYGVPAASGTDKAETLESDQVPKLEPVIRGVHPVTVPPTAVSSAVSVAPGWRRSTGTVTPSGTGMTWAGS